MVCLRLFDLHCDTLFECNALKCNIDNINLCINIEAAKGFERYIQCFAVFVPDELRGEQAELHAKKLISVFETQKKRFKEFFEYCMPVLTVEGGAALGGKLENIKYFHDRGVRVMTLTWNGENEIAGGAFSDAGFSDFGKSVVKEMEAIGIIADVSHLNEKSFYELCEFSKHPFIATHSCSRAVTDHVRNLTNDQFKEIRNRKGIVGITLADQFLHKDGNANFDDILRHTENFLSLGGENIVAFGSDFDGAQLPKDIKSISDVFKLYNHFLKHNYSEQLLDKIFFENANNFFERHGGLK